MTRSNSPTEDFIDILSDILPAFSYIFTDDSKY